MRRHHNTGSKGRDKNWSKSRGRYTNIEYYYYDKKGHIKKYRRKLKVEKSKEKLKEVNSGDEHIVAITKELLILCELSKVNLLSQDTN